MIRGLLPLVARSRGEGLDPLQGELLDDVEPLPLGRELARPLIELLTKEGNLGVVPLTEIDDLGREPADRLVLGRDGGLALVLERSPQTGR